MAYVDVVYTTDQWKKVCQALKMAVSDMSRVVGDVSQLELRAEREDSGFYPFPTVITHLDVLQNDFLYRQNLAVLHALPDNTTGFKYKYLIKAGRPALFTKGTISTFLPTQSRLVVDGGDPFSVGVTGGVNGDRVTVRWINDLDTLREVTGLFVDTIATVNTLIFTALVDPECITNGDFAAAAGWTAGAGWVIGAGIATAGVGTVTTLAQLQADLAQPIVAGRIYRMQYSYNIVVGAFTPYIGTVAGTMKTSGAGVAVETFELPVGSEVFSVYFQPHVSGGGFRGTIDNVIVKEVMPVDSTSVEVELEAVWV